MAITLKPGPGELDGERKAHVAQADDADDGSTVGDFVGQ